jgi:long-chain acyl-CoA synthetase
LQDDLGLDSLRVVEILSVIEDELGVYVDESGINESTTVEDLERLASRSDEASQRPVFWEWPLNGGASVARIAVQSLIAFPMARLFMPEKVEGLVNLANIEGPVIFAANHLSHMDTPAIVSALPLRWRKRVAVAAAADVWFEQGKLAAFIGAFLLNAFPFSRSGNVRPTLEHTSRLLRRGWSILIYPEGTRSNDGRMGPFKSGTGLMAVEMGVPVIPVHIQGTYEVLKKNATKPRRHKVAVRFGKPLCFPSNTPYADAVRTIESAVWCLGNAESRREYVAGSQA